MTQQQFPHLIVVSDAEQNVAKAMQVLHPGQDPKGGDSNAPTTFIVDGSGTVRWNFRPSHVITRLSPDDLLKAVEESL